jgi:triosephosphate isomerase (TIM)
MKKLLLVGNWKSNKDVTESVTWLSSFFPKLQAVRGTMGESMVVVCAPFSDLYPMKKTLDDYCVDPSHANLPFMLGAQDVSPFVEGAYTGEVSARMLKELVDWVIIGHSERRKFLHENDEELFKEVIQAKSAGLRVLYCVPNLETAVPPGVDAIGYEPVWAIGTGKADTPENANQTLTNIKSKTGVSVVLYGGSVTADNVATYAAQPAIDGVLVGGASLDPDKFLTLVTKAIGT